MTGIGAASVIASPRKRSSHQKDWRGCSSGGDAPKTATEIDFDALTARLRPINPSAASSADPTGPGNLRTGHDRPHAWLRDARHPRWRAARSHNWRARYADLPDHLVRIRGRRPRGLAVRPADVRQHLY